MGRKWTEALDRLTYQPLQNGFRFHVLPRYLFLRFSAPRLYSLVFTHLDVNTVRNGNGEMEFWGGSKLK